MRVARCLPWTAILKLNALFPGRWRGWEGRCVRRLNPSETVNMAEAELLSRSARLLFHDEDVVVDHDVGAGFLLVQLLDNLVAQHQSAAAVLQLVQAID